MAELHCRFGQATMDVGNSLTPKPAILDVGNYQTNSPATLESGNSLTDSPVTLKTIDLLNLVLVKKTAILL